MAEVVFFLFYFFYVERIGLLISVNEKRHTAIMQLESTIGVGSTRAATLSNLSRNCI